jgi:hypothetical protein
MILLSKAVGKCIYKTTDKSMYYTCFQYPEAQVLGDMLSQSIMKAPRNISLPLKYIQLQVPHSSV